MTLDELKEKARDLPLKPGVYLMSDQSGTIIYVGKAKALKNRVSQYFQDAASHTDKTRAMVAQIDHFDVIVTQSEFEALVLECALIKRHMPRYNILLKDGKGYPYIRVSTQNLYPQFSLVGKPADDGAKYFGPFGGRTDSQAIIDALQVALKLPSCGKKFPRDQGKERPCLNFHMGRCDGYCRKEVPLERHREAMGQAIRLLEGKFSEVEKDLQDQMLQAAENLEFEKAASLRDRLRAIELLGKRQKVVSGKLSDTDVAGLWQGEGKWALSVLHYRDGELSGKDTELFPLADEMGEDILAAFLKQYYTSRAVPPRRIFLPLALEDQEDLSQMLSQQVGRKVELLTPQRGERAEMLRLAQENAREECRRATSKEEKIAWVLTALGDLLRLPGPPRRIEAYDISNTGKSNIVASMTVFVDGKPKRGDFRYFKLRDLDGPDDYASMEQVVSRRLRHAQEGDESFGDLPDLFLIDGGDRHAAVARRALEEQGLTIPVFGMVKDGRHRTRALISPDGEELGIQTVPALFAFVGQIQEETHHAAITFHQKQRSRTATGSALEQIPGVGAARRKVLLKTFRSVKGIREASLDELVKVLPQNAAQAVYHHFHIKEEKPCALSQEAPGDGG